MAQVAHGTIVSTQGADANNTFTISINTNDTSGSDRLLVCGVMGSDGDSNTVSSAVWDGGSQTMTKQVEGASVGIASALFTLTSFTEANSTITVTFSGTEDNYIGWAGVFYNVDTAAPITDTESATGNASSYSLTGMTGEGADDLIIDNLAIEGTGVTLTQGANQTENVDTTSAGGGYSVAGASSEQDGSDGVAMTYTSSASDLYGYVAMIIKGSTGSSATSELIDGGLIDRFIVRSLIK